MRKPFLVPMPEGIPTYSSRHGRHKWERGHPPIFHLNNDWDLFWVLRGEATWILKNGRKLIAGKNQFVLLPPFVSGYIHESKPGLDFYYCHFNFRLSPRSIMQNVMGDLFQTDEPVLLPLTFDAAEAPRVRETYRRIMQQRDAKTSRPWQLESGVIDLVSELVCFARHRQTAKPRGILLNANTREDSRVSAVCNRINADPTHPWRVSELAQSVGLSASRMHSLLLRHQGVNLKQFIIRARLQRAMKLLKDRPENHLPSIKEVSVASGFSSQHFFSRQFKEHFHMTPVDYRDSAMLL